VHRKINSFRYRFSRMKIAVTPPLCLENRREDGGLDGATVIIEMKIESGERGLNQRKMYNNRRRKRIPSDCFTDVPLHLTTAVHGHFLRKSQTEHVLNIFVDSFSVFKTCPSLISVQVKTCSLRSLEIKKDVPIKWQVHF